MFTSVAQAVQTTLADGNGLFGPTPPMDSHVKSAAAEWIFLWVMTAIFTGGSIFALVHSWRTRSWIPILCMVGGVLCIFTESMVDSHLQVWWPTIPNPTPSPRTAATSR